MKCSACGTESGDSAPRCAGCGAELPAVEATVLEATVLEEGDSTGGLIPYKNPQALIAYYLGILSGLPFIGLPMGIAAFILGWRGWQARKANPLIKGSVHAGIGMGCGCFFALLWTAILGLVVVAILDSKR